MKNRMRSEICTSQSFSSMVEGSFCIEISCGGWWSTCSVGEGSHSLLQNGRNWGRYVVCGDLEGGAWRIRHDDCRKENSGHSRFEYARHSQVGQRCLSVRFTTSEHNARIYQTFNFIVYPSALRCFLSRTRWCCHGR